MAVVNRPEPPIDRWSMSERDYYDELWKIRERELFMFNPRVRNLLARKGIHTLNELIRCNGNYLRYCTGVGPYTIYYIREVLKDYGLEFDCGGA